MEAQLYIVEGAKGKTHLARINWDGDLALYCSPSNILFASWCGDEDNAEPAGREEAENWDTYHNEVTCPTCLKKALGKETAIPMEV